MSKDSTSQNDDQELSEWGILITVVLGGVLAPLNSTMIAVTLPRIMEAFDAPLTSAGWLVTAYLIAMASLQPITGKLGDRLGRRRLILGGLVYFGCASIGAAMASGFWMLLFFRIQQAIAGAILLPNGVALMREVVPEKRRASRFGLVGSAMALSATAGPPLGGFLVAIADWHAIFYVNLVFILPALLLGWRVLPIHRASQGGSSFDLRGTLLLGIVLMGAAGLLILNAERLLISIVGVCVVLAVAVYFFWYEWQHPDPVLQLRFFCIRKFAAANGAVALSNLAMYSTMLAVPILLSRQSGWSSTQTGLVLTALMATSVIFAPIGGHLADRWGRRWPAVCGLSLFSFALLPLALTGGDVSIVMLVCCLGVSGIGLGVAGAGIQTSAVEAVERQQAGAASGIYATSRYLGSIIGSSVLIRLLKGNGEEFAAVFLMVTVAAFCSVLVSFGLRDRPEH
ncbi:MAG: MFS transporter [Candidatus Latescibacteria bacterium]|nr:MFS transporter [Candidatus Latescibacterota bacterium]